MLPPLLRRLFALSGVAPLGAFLIVHAALNVYAVQGHEAFLRLTDAEGRIPGLGLIEALFVFAPLGFHALVGLWLIATRRPLAEPSPYPPAVRLAVRATGVASLAFLALHVPELRGRMGARLDGGVLETLLAGDLSALTAGVPWRGLAYLAGAACTAFHFAAGVWAFFARSRAGARDRSRRWAAWAAGIAGAALWFGFADAAIFHATGAALVGGPSPDATSPEPCPVGSSETAR